MQKNASGCVIGTESNKSEHLGVTSGLGSSVGIATDYGLKGPGSSTSGARFSARPDRPWGPSNLL